MKGSSVATRPERAPSGNAERAYQTLVRAMATCELPPGMAFNERDQAASLGMSRTPLRQALHRLALEGLVETVPQRGVYVSLLDAKLIHDHTVVREVLEVELLRVTIEQERPVDFPRLDALMRTMAETLRAADAPAFLEADEQFHLILASAAGNRPASTAIQSSWIHVNRVRYLQNPGPSSLRAALREHKAMLLGVRRRDAVGAETAVRAHMERSRSRLRELNALIPDAFVAPATHVCG